MAPILGVRHTGLRCGVSSGVESKGVLSGYVVFLIFKFRGERIV